jgi:hypothetical protein
MRHKLRTVRRKDFQIDFIDSLSGDMVPRQEPFSIGGKWYGSGREGVNGKSGNLAES